MALQALTMEGAFAARDLDITITAAGKPVGTVHIDESNNDLVFYIDLRPYLDPSNTTRVELSSRGQGRGVFQVFYEEHLPWNRMPDRPGDLGLTLRVFNTRLPVNMPTRMELGVKYTGGNSMLKMVLVEIPLPAGLCNRGGRQEATSSTRQLPVELSISLRAERTLLPCQCG